MNEFELAKKVLNFLVPVLKTKAGKKISGEISEAFNNEAILLWNKIKPIFIKEEFIKELEENPENEKAQNGFLYFLSSKLDSDEGLKKELLKIIQNPKLKEGQTIINQSHFGTGDIIGRDKIINK